MDALRAPGLDDDWEWPEEKPITSSYYTTALGGLPPPPKILDVKTVVEDDDVSKRITMVRNYSWSDDTNYVRVYVPIPGVVREGVTVDIDEEEIKLVAKTPEYGQFTMALQRLYDKVDVSKVCASTCDRRNFQYKACWPPPHATCRMPRAAAGERSLLACLRRVPEQSTFKVLERKEKVTIMLAKFPPPGYGTDSSYINFKPWYKLHHGGTNNIDVIQQFEDARLQRGVRMNEANTPKMPTMPTTKRRED